MKLGEIETDYERRTWTTNIQVLRAHVLSFALTEKKAVRSVYVCGLVGCWLVKASVLAPV